MTELSNLFIGKMVHYVMEGKEPSHVAGIVAYIDPDNPDHVNLCVPCGSKKGKGFTPATLAYTDVEYDGNAERVMTWHFIEEEQIPGTHGY